MPYFPSSRMVYPYDWHGMPAHGARAATTRALGTVFGGPQSGPPGPLDVGAVVDSIPGGKMTVLAIAGLVAWVVLGKKKRRSNPRKRSSALSGPAWITLSSGRKVRRGSKAHRASVASKRAWARRRRGRSVVPPRASPTMRPWETMWRYEGVRAEKDRPREFVNPRRRRRRRRR